MCRFAMANRHIPPSLMLTPTAFTFAEPVNRSTELFHHWRGERRIEEYLRRKIMGIEQGYRASQGEAKITKVHYGSSVGAGANFNGSSHASPQSKKDSGFLRYNRCRNLPHFRRCNENDCPLCDPAIYDICTRSSITCSYRNYRRIY